MSTYRDTKVTSQWKWNLDPYPYNGLILQGKNAIEVTNWDAEGDSFNLSLSRYDTAVQTNDLKPWFNRNIFRIKNVEQIFRDHKKAYATRSLLCDAKSPNISITSH